jgi:hypothetical protein
MKTRLGLSGTLAAVIAGTLLLGGGGARGEDACISYLYPSTPGYELSAEVRNIAVVKPEYLDRENDNGLMKDYLDRWYRVLIRRLEERFGSAVPGIRVLDREDTVMRETEIRRAGDDVDSEDQGPAAAFIADAQIVPRFGLECHSEKISVKKTALEKIADWGTEQIPLVGSEIANHDEYKDIVRVTVVVYCDLKLQYPRTGVVAIAYNDVLVNYEQTKSGILDIGSKNLSQFEPVQQVVDRLIQEHVDAFLSKFLPIERHFQAEFKAGKEVQVAIGQLNAGNLKGANKTAWARFETNKRKDADAAFVVGATWELLGDHVEARTWYNRAHGLRADEMAFSLALERENRRVEALRSAARPSASTALITSQREN